MSAPYHLLGQDEVRRAGLILLRADETLEGDLRALIPRELRLHITRVPSGAEVTTQSLAAMEASLGAATDLLPEVDFDIVGYACTSGATVIGPEVVAERVRAQRQARRITDPLSAACAGFAQLGLSRIAILSPYLAPVADALADAFVARGLSVAGALSFGEAVESRVASIDPASTRDAAIALAQSCDAQAVFLSCTNLQTLDILEEIETATGRPCLSSNQALAWDLARGAGLQLSGPGQLLT